MNKETLDLCIKKEEPKIRALDVQTGRAITDGVIQSSNPICPSKESLTIPKPFVATSLQLAVRFILTLPKMGFVVTYLK